jgi:two-component system sensor histidine kinase UhpB
MRKSIGGPMGSIWHHRRADDRRADKKAEAELWEGVRLELERTVDERTSQLAAVSDELRREIGDRGQAEALLRDANNRIEVVLNSITDWFFAVDSNWRYTYVSKHAEEQVRRLGKDPATFVGKLLWDQFPDPPIEPILRRAMEERVVITHELYYAPLGEWVENRIYPSADGGLAIFQKYVTEQKKAAVALQRSEAYLAEAQRLTHTGNGVWNVSTGEVLWSDETYRLYGFEPGGTTPSYDVFLHIVHPDDRLMVEEGFAKVVRDRAGFKMDFRIVRPDGVMRHVHSVGHPVFDGSGELTEVIGTVLDVTDRVLAEQERTQLLRRLIASQEEERHRLSREMHDHFGQQLNALMLKIAALKDDCHRDVHDQIESLTAIVRQLDADVDTLVWDLRPLVLDDLGLVVALSNYVTTWSKDCGIHAELHTSGMDDDRLTGEIETVLYRVLQEALTNVAKHAGAVNVDVLLERRASHVSLIVEDDGHGYDAEAAFVPGPGGLGLVGMRERVLLVGGELELQSQPGHGATTFVRIPTPRAPIRLKTS